MLGLILSRLEEADLGAPTDFCAWCDKLDVEVLDAGAFVALPLHLVPRNPQARASSAFVVGG